MRVFEQAQGFVERAADSVNLDGPLRDGSLGGGGFVIDALLFELELIEREGVVVVGGLSLGALVLQPGETLALTVNFGLALGMTTLEVGQDDGLERLDTVFRQLDAVPVLGNGMLNVGDRDVALWATVLIFLAAEAVEVRVRLPCSLLGRGGYAKPPTAASAEKTPLEVVRTGLGFVFVEVPSGQDGIDGVEGSLVDERFVVTGVFHAAISDDPEVVTVAQDAVHLLGLEGPFGQALGGRQPQAQVVGFIGEIANGIEAGGIAAEAVRDDRPGDGIDHDHPDVLAGDPHALVDVPEWGLARRAACLDLLAHALLGLFAQVPGVPLGDGGHDPVYKLAGRGFVDVLRSRDEFDAVFGK